MHNNRWLIFEKGRIKAFDKAKNTKKYEKFFEKWGNSNIIRF